MKDIPPTRSALLDLQDKRGLAEKGHKLLEKKRDALIHEFFDRINEYKDHKQHTYEHIKDAYRQLHIAQGRNGVDLVRSIGQSLPEQFTIQTDTNNIMGVTVPDYTVSIQETKKTISLLDADSTVDTTQAMFLDVIQKITKLHELEAIIHRLSDAIQRTKRRVNSLEHIQIPAMKEEEARVEQHLLEKERQSFVRLKQLKDE